MNANSTPDEFTPSIRYTASQTASGQAGLWLGVLVTGGLLLYLAGQGHSPTHPPVSNPAMPMVTENRQMTSSTQP
ncbi:MAG: hypothetical protein RIS79_985 [Verrucomicrobiota bacterium]|jgi:hypothetical protein